MIRKATVAFSLLALFAAPLASLCAKQLPRAAPEAVGSVGNYYWYGIRGTSFWVDPEEDLIGVFMIQIRPNRDVTFRRRFKRLVYQALIE